MSIYLKNPAGKTINLSNGHWSVYLTLAQCFGWKPTGTQRPPSVPLSLEWKNGYDSSDGQIVTDADAKSLAQILHAAALHEKLGIALTDIILNIEQQVQLAGANIPENMRMKPSDFNEEFSPLLMFLYQGTFSIE